MGRDFGVLLHGSDAPALCTQGDHGCNGGLMDYAFTFIEQNGGLDTEKDYQYDALQETCQVCRPTTPLSFL